jgi:hypothetical protein
MNGNTPAQHPLSLLAKDRRQAGGRSDTDVENLEMDAEFSFVESTIIDHDGNPGNFFEAASLFEGE